MVRVGGREFSGEILKRIAETVSAESEISRRQLSRRVCEWMGWQNVSGRLQEMSCRKSLVELDRRGLIALPPVRKRYTFQQVRQSACPPLATAECSAEESSISGQQQPVSDRTEREGEMLGVLGAGARGEALGAGLGASLRLSTGIDGELRGARPLCRDMLSGGELDVGGR